MWLAVPGVLALFVIVVLMVTRGAAAGLAWGFGLVAADAVVTFVFVQVFVAVLDGGTSDPDDGVAVLIGLYCVFVGTLLGAVVHELAIALASAHYRQRGER